MFIFILYYIFFFLFHNNNNFINSQFYSINSNSDFSLSEEIKNLTNFFPYFTNIQTISSNYLVENLQVISIEINYNFDLSRLNDEFGTINYKIHDVFFNGENHSLVYDFSEYFYNNSFQAKKINFNNDLNKNNSNYKKLIEINNDKDLNIKKFGCEFRYGKNFLKADSEKNFSIGFKKILNMKTISFGLGIDNNLYQINNNLTDDNENDENVFILDKNDDCLNVFGSIKNFFVSNNNLILFNNKISLICVYKINFTSFNLNEINDEFFLDENENETELFNFNIENKNNKNIIQIKIKNNIVYILFENSNSIITFNLNNSEFGLNYNFYLEENEIIDFVINSETIYAIIKNFGFIIFDISNGEIIEEVPLKSAISIDRFINPFTGKLFVGIFLNNSNSDEFFVELYVKNEKSLFLNKVLVYKDNFHYNFSNYVSFDSLFSYFFDNANGKIIVIRRGLFSDISFYSYIFSIKNILKEEDLSSYKIIPFQREKNIGRLLPFLYSKNKYLSFKNFMYINNEFNITFYKEGTYTIMLSHVSDSCNENVDNYKINEIYCLDLLSIRFKVFGDEKNNHTILIVCIFGGITFLFLIPGFVTIFIVKLKDKEFSLKVKSKVDKENKEKLYKKQNEYNNKRNYKISTKQFNYQLFLNDEDTINNKSDIKNEHKPQNSYSGNEIENFIDFSSFNNNNNNNNNNKINIKDNIYKNIMINNKNSRKNNYDNDSEISRNLKYNYEKNNILVMNSNRNNNNNIENNNNETNRK